MRLRVLNSGSKANGYLLYNDSEALVIECGCPYSSCLEALDFDRKKIVGAFVTHEHGDHAKFVDQYLNAGIKVYASQGTIDSLSVKSAFKPSAVANKQCITVGGFVVCAFSTKHDSAEPMGFLVVHKDLGTLLFATDTYYLEYKFAGLTAVMIECNYDLGILDENVNNGVIKKFVRDRVLKSHMSLETTISTLKANDLTRVNKVVLLHLSNHNSNPEMFREKVEQEVGKVVYIAEKGLDINLNEL